MNTTYESPFKKFVFPKNLNPNLFWGVVALLVFITYGFLGNLLNPNLNWTSSIFFSSMVFFVPYMTITFQNFLNEILTKGRLVFGLNFLNISNKLFEKGFSLYSRGCIITAATITILFNISVAFIWQSGIPLIPTVILYIFVQPSVFICGQAAYFLIVLIVYLSRITKLTPLSYFKYEPISLMDSFLKKYTFTLSIVAITYFLLVATVAMTPFGFNLITLTWTSVLAVWPFTLLVSSFYLINDFKKEYKQKKLEQISEKIENNFEKLNGSIDKLDYIQKLFEMYHTVMDERISHRDIGSILRALFSIVALITQIFIALATISSTKGQNIIDVIKGIFGF